MTRKFQRVISLGNFCLTKYQINRHICRKFFALDPNSTSLAADFIKTVPKNILGKINGGNAIFDWTVIVDYQKVSRLISNGLNYTLNKDDLVERFDTNGKRTGIEDTKSGFVWVHLFEDGGDTAPWAEQIYSLNAKVKNLVRNFTSSRDFTTVYIVTLADDMVASGVPGDIYRSLSILRGRKTPDFSLVVALPGDAELPQDGENLFYRRFSDKPDLPEYGWLGNAASWDKIFEEFTFVAERI